MCKRTGVYTEIIYILEILYIYIHHIYMHTRRCLTEKSINIYYSIYVYTPYTYALTQVCDKNSISIRNSTYLCTPHMNALTQVSYRNTYEKFYIYLV